MTEFQINDYILQKECDDLAKLIFDEIASENPDVAPDDLRDEFDARAHETADWHEWVIYNHKALMLCAHCDVSQGEEFLEDVGMSETPTIYSLACTIAYGEMRARIMEEIEDLIENRETEEKESEE